MTIISNFGETITVTYSGAVGHIRLNRPAVRNAFDRGLIDALTSAARWFDDEQEDIKVVILSGEGKSFCAGFDLAQFSPLSNPEAVRSSVDAGRKMVQTIAKMRAITIAAVHGHCIGGGVLLAMACDFRYASACAKFALPETDLGIPLAWAGVPWLTREMGTLFAMEFILTCCEWSAAEAFSRGMLNSVVEPDRLISDVTTLAERLACHSPFILETTKAQFLAAKQDLCSDAHSFADAHLLHSALVDERSKLARKEYLAGRSKKA